MRHLLALRGPAWAGLLFLGALGALGCDDAGTSAAVDLDASVVSDGGTDAMPPERGTCEAPPTATGALANGVFDVDFTGEPVTATVRHKLDIDEAEDGCVVSAQFLFRKADLGCEFTLRYASVNAEPLALVDAQLSADSFCPGWSDDDEGDYALASGTSTLRFVSRVPDRTAETSCIGNATARFDGRIQMRRADGRLLELTLDQLSAAGDFTSVGDTEAVCPCTPQCGESVCGDEPICGTSCGECAASDECTPEGQCVCVPDCEGRACGDDGCDGTCGAGCADGELCDPESGQCGCVPSCDGRVCGADGCGGVCGPGCDGNAECDEGTGQCLAQCPVTVCPGPVTIDDNAGMAALADCGHIDGNLTIGGTVDTLEGVECLQSVSGTLLFWSAPLVEITAFERLESVASLVFRGNVTTRIVFPRLSTVTEALTVDALRALVAMSFPALVTLDGRLTVAGCVVLPSLDGFSTLQSAGHVGVSRNDLLTDLAPLQALRTLGSFDARSNDTLRQLTGLEAITDLPNGLRIIDNDQLQDLRGLDALATLSSALVQDNRALRSLDGLDALERAGFNVTVMDNRALSSVQALSALESVGSTLKISGSPNVQDIDLPRFTTTDTLTLDGLGIRDLDGFNTVRQIGDTLRIENNDRLLSLEGLEGASVGSRIVIQGNSALDHCAAQAFVDQVTPEGWRGVSTVSDNDESRVCDSLFQYLMWHQTYPLVRKTMARSE